MKTFNATRTGNNNTRNTDYHIVEQAGHFKVYDGAGRFRLTFATREAAQAYIDGKHRIDGHTAFQMALSVLVALFLLCWPLVSQAETVACRWPWQGALIWKIDEHGNRYRGITCIYVVPGGKPHQVQP